jgi:hypothetical protein
MSRITIQPLVTASSVHSVYLTHVPTQRSFFDIAAWTLIFTILGVGIGAFATLHQLSEIRKSVSRRADLSLGFIKDDEVVYGKEKELLASRQIELDTLDSSGQFVKEITVALVNGGALTARNILVNVWLPKTINVVNGEQARVRHSKYNVYAITSKDLTQINPGDGQSLSFPLQIPRNTKSFTMKFNVSNLDAAEKLYSLKVICKDVLSRQENNT